MDVKCEEEETGEGGTRGDKKRSSTYLDWSIELVQAGTAGVRYFEVFLIVRGAFVLMPDLMMCMANCIKVEDAESAVAMALLTEDGNWAALVSSNVLMGNPGPRYLAGYGSSLVLKVTGGVCLKSLRWR